MLKMIYAFMNAQSFVFAIQLLKINDVFQLFANNVYVHETLQSMLNISKLFFVKDQDSIFQTILDGREFFILLFVGICLLSYLMIIVNLNEFFFNQFKIIKNMSELTSYQKFVLNHQRQKQLSKLMQTRFQQVLQFRNQIRPLKYTKFQTQAAYALFLTDLNEIKMVDKEQLDFYRIIFKNQQIPELLKNKYQTVQNCLSFFHIPIIWRLRSTISYYFKLSTKNASKRLKNIFGCEKQGVFQEQQTELLSENKLKTNHLKDSVRS